MLALVCLTRAENFRKKSLINYNIACLKKALKSLVQLPVPQNVPPSSTADDDNNNSNSIEQQQELDYAA